MGFTTPFFSGLILTSTTLYLSLLYHQRARTHQAAMLHQQTLLLNSLVDPNLASDLAAMDDANYSGGLREGIRDYKVVRAPWTERWKDGWNKEIVNAVKWIQGVDWRDVREGVEGRAKEWKEGERRV